MTPEQFQKAAELFRNAPRRAQSERAAWLNEVCANDADLRAAVERMLEADAAFLSHDGPSRDPDGTTVRKASIADRSDAMAEGGTQRGNGQRPVSVGPWRVQRELGRGGMGIVYAAERKGESFRQRAALKLLKRGLDTEDVLRRFEQERQLLAMLNHTGIARLYDAAETDDGLPYFAMEYVDGTPIDEFCDEHRLSIESRLELFQKVCRAVHYAHQNLVVHRDLKPGNILVTEGGEPKLLDFGIAKVINPDFALLGGEPTAPERRIMTPEYASPEQVRGRPITTASDVYSLGIILYELITGRRPHHLRARTREEVERIICEEDPERPSAALTHDDEEAEAEGTGTLETASRARDTGPHRLRRRVAGDLDNIVLKALRKEPQRRYPSAEAFADDIDRHLRGLPVTARPDTLTYRAGKFVRRHRVGVAAAVVVAMALGGGVVGTTSGWQRARSERAQAERRFEQVQELARILMHDLHDSIAPLNGSTVARRLLVDTALGYLEALSQEVGDDLELRADLAAAYTRLGDIQGGMRNSELGDAEAAQRSYERAHVMWLELVDTDPAREDWRRSLAKSHLRFGDRHRREGEYEEALACYRSEEEIVAAIHAERPDDRGACWDLSISLVNVGNAMRLCGDLDGAIAANKRAIDLRERGLADRSLPQGEVDAKQRDLAVAYNRLSGNYGERGDLESALDMAEHAIKIRQDLVAKNPKNGRWQRDLANSRYQKARLLAQDRDAPERLDESVLLLEQYLEVMDRRLADDPVDARSMRDVGNGHYLLARVHLKRGDAEQAIKHARASAEVLTPYAAAHPNEVTPAYLLASGAVCRAQAARLVRDPQAIELMRRAIDRFGAVCAQVPSRSDFQMELAWSQVTLSKWHAEDGQREDEMESLQAARDIYAKLLEARRCPAGTQDRLDEVDERLEALSPDAEVPDRD